MVFLGCCVLSSVLLGKHGLTAVWTKCVTSVVKFILLIALSQVLCDIDKVCLCILIATELRLETPWCYLNEGALSKGQTGVI